MLACCMLFTSIDSINMFTNKDLKVELITQSLESKYLFKHHSKYLDISTHLWLTDQLIQDDFF